MSWLMRCAAAAFAIAIMPATATAQTPQEFYKGRTLTLLVSHPAGGGVDLYARFYGRHLKRLMAGHPEVVVRNMPGAGGVAMANHMAAQAVKDGSVIGLGSGWIATAALSGPTGARYDARQFSWIGSLNAEVGVFIAWHDQPVKTVADLESKELTVAAGGLSALTATAPISLQRLLGLKLKVISGYAGTADQMLALERGEVGGIGGYNYTGLKSSRPQWLTEKKVNILLQYSFASHPDLAAVPTLDKVVRTSEQRQILEVIVRPQEMGRPLFGPPGIPADRLQALRDAFDAFVKDAEVIADAEKSKIEILKPMNGNAVSAIVDSLHKASPELYRKAAEAMLPADVSGAIKAKR